MLLWASDGNAQSFRYQSNHRSRLSPIPLEKLFPSGELGTSFTLPEIFQHVIPLQSRSGPENPQWKIPPSEWPVILDRIDHGELLREIASDYGVSYRTIRNAEKAARQALNLPERPPHLWKIPSSEWLTIIERIDRGDAFSQIAKDYEVSSKVIRRVEKAARQALNLPERPPRFRCNITPSEWPSILRRLNQGETRVQIARDYRISETSMRRIEKAARQALNI